jgi:hypothetical protein
MQTLESKDLKTSHDTNGNKILPSSSSSFSITLNKILLKEEEIEANKDKLDLKPNIDFVSRNIEKYEAGLEKILGRIPCQDTETWSQQISFNGTEDIVCPQVLPEKCRKILAHMPKSLIELSKLQTVDYHTFGNVRVIPVPGFDDQGNFDSSKVQLVPVSEFPREGDHPSRILVGVSIGNKIFPTPIPKTVSEDKRATYLYQVHVLLHEFFHTIDYPRRNPEERAKIILKVD